MIPALTLTPSLNSRSWLHSSDQIPHRENTQAQKLYNSFTGISQNLTKQELGHELSGTDDSIPTFNTP